MEWVETTAKTVEEAKELALDQLGVDANEAEFETLEEPKSGLFGRTRGTARVRARVSPLTPRPKTERRRRTKKGSGGEAAGERSSSKSTATKKSPAKKATAKPARSDAEDDSPAAASTVEAGDAATASDTESSAPKSRSRRRNGSSGASSDESQNPREPMDENEQISVLEEFLTELATSFGLSATAESTLDDGELRVNLVGESLGLLVGPRLATLDAVQEIARNTLQRQAAGREYAKVIVDVAGIRERRREALSEFVTNAATTVRDDDTTVVFEVMNSADRKQVHDVAAEIDGVRSVSEGEDPRRRVVLKAD